LRTDKIVSIFQLEGEQRELAEVIGLESYKKLVEWCGGSSVYIKKSDTLTRNQRNDEIRRDFNGRNYKEIARKYNLSESSIRKILSDDK